MSEVNLFNEAASLTDDLIRHVLEQLRNEADKYNYEFEWIVQRFRDRFNDIYMKEVAN